MNHEAAAARADGPDGFRGSGSLLRTMFEELSFEIDEVIEADDNAVIPCRMTGRYVGAYLGVPPTGRRFSAKHIHIFRVEGRKVREHWAGRDDLGMMRELAYSSLADPYRPPSRVRARRAGRFDRAPVGRAAAWRSRPWTSLTPPAGRGSPSAPPAWRIGLPASSETDSQSPPAATRGSLPGRPRIRTRRSRASPSTASRFGRFRDTAPSERRSAPGTWTRTRSASSPDAIVQRTSRASHAALNQTQGP